MNHIWWWHLNSVQGTGHSQLMPVASCRGWAACDGAWALGQPSSALRPSSVILTRSTLTVGPPILSVSVTTVRSLASTSADSDEGGQLFRLKADSNSDRLRTPFR